MPRLYAQNQTHSIDWGHVDFIEGVSAVPAGSDTTYWAGAHYTVDTSKHALSPFDYLSVAALVKFLTYAGVAVVEADTKQTLVRKAEKFVSDEKLATLTVTSAAGTEDGDTLVTVTAGAVGTEGNTFAFATAGAALTPYYRDVPADAYTAFTSGTDVTPMSATHTKITVVELNAAGEVVAVGSATITKKV